MRQSIDTVRILMENIDGQHLRPPVLPVLSYWKLLKWKILIANLSMFSCQKLHYTACELVHKQIYTGLEQTFKGSNL